MLILPPDTFFVIPYCKRRLCLVVLLVCVGRYHIASYKARCVSRAHLLFF